MHLSRSQRLNNLSDEEGTSMVELVVGMAMGMVVLAGLSLLLIVTLHGNARVDARVEASDNARLTMTRIMEELHSACVNPTIAPVQANSNGTKLIFKHGTYGQAAEASASPITTEIWWSADGTLKEKDTPGATRTLLSNVSPVGTKIFTYENPPTRFEGTLKEEEAGHTILVKVAFKASPKSEPVADAGAATEIENSAVLRLTPPTYEPGKVAKPCE